MLLLPCRHRRAFSTGVSHHFERPQLLDYLPLMESKQPVAVLRQIGCPVCRLISDVDYDAANLCRRIARRPDRYGAAKIIFKFWLFSGLAIAVCADSPLESNFLFPLSDTTPCGTNWLAVVQTYRSNAIGNILDGLHSAIGRPGRLLKEQVRFFRGFHSLQFPSMWFIGSMKQSPACPLNVQFRPKKTPWWWFFRWIYLAKPDWLLQNVGSDTQKFSNLSCWVEI